MSSFLPTIDRRSLTPNHSSKSDFSSEHRSDQTHDQRKDKIINSPSGYFSGLDESEQKNWKLFYEHRGFLAKPVMRSNNPAANSVLVKIDILLC